jgi:glycosyltransferase involved in cell wall biosynthesis
MTPGVPAGLEASGAVPRSLPRGPLPEHPSVTVILAVRNEERHIARALDAVCGQSYPRAAIEILVVDGESDDRTRDVVTSLTFRDPRVRLLHNPLRRVACGLNVGLRAARGEVIVRVDGHCVIPPDYVATCVRMLHADGTDCAGGPVRAEGETTMGRAIALAMSTPFGRTPCARWTTCRSGRGAARCSRSSVSSMRRCCATRTTS